MMQKKLGTAMLAIISGRAMGRGIKAQKKLGTAMLAMAMAASMSAGCSKIPEGANGQNLGSAQEQGLQEQQESQQQDPVETKAPNKTETVERADLPDNGATAPEATGQDSAQAESTEPEGAQAKAAGQDSAQAGAAGQDSAQAGAAGQDSAQAGAAGQDSAQAGAAEPEEARYPEITSNGSVLDFGGVVVVDDAAYELYEYLDKPADNYVQALNAVAANLKGKAEIYNLIIPLSSGITFPDNLRDQIHSEDQQEAMAKIQGRLADNINIVDSYRSLMEHRNEYIYFRTDHHWTALGAHYAYQDFCAAKGIEPEPLDSYETVIFDNFLGSFYYTDTNNCGQLKASPDSVTAYHPNMDAIMHIVDPDGVEYDSKVIYDESNAKDSLKYCCFIAGDNPYTEIVNNELKDGSSCVVIKDSFGNAFVPFLVDHYQTIHVIDYRYWVGSISEFAAEKNVDDVVFLNNLSMTRSNKEVGKLYRVI